MKTDLELLLARTRRARRPSSTGCIGWGPESGRGGQVRRPRVVEAPTRRQTAERSKELPAKWVPVRVSASNKS
jgi:hypothetical protein